jgi:hypothetical protein
MPEDIKDETMGEKEKICICFGIFPPRQLSREDDNIMVSFFTKLFDRTSDELASYTMVLAMLCRAFASF